MTSEKDRNNNVERKRWNEKKSRERVTISFIYTIQQYIRF